VSVSTSARIRRFSKIAARGNSVNHAHLGWRLVALESAGCRWIDDIESTGPRASLELSCPVASNVVSCLLLLRRCACLSLRSCDSAHDNDFEVCQPLVNAISRSGYQPISIPVRRNFEPGSGTMQHGRRLETLCLARHMRM
jgi:hypothetical protein